jgi:16S rRNA processing protein RimM
LNKEDCRKLGTIISVHGIKGGLTVIREMEDVSFLNKLESVFIEINNRLVPFFIQSAVPKNKSILFRFDGINAIDQAELLKNLSVYIPVSSLPAPEQKVFRFQEIIGFKVKDNNLGIIGILEGILEFPLQNIFQIVNSDKIEILVPCRQEFISKIDRANKCLELNTPEGLLDVYLK